MDLKNNIIGFHHVCIKANDVEKTVAFYKCLGFQRVHRWSLPQINMQNCVMLHHKTINYFLEICDENADMPTQGRKRVMGDPYIENALLHICFMVKDAELARQQALECGAKDLSGAAVVVDISSSTKTKQVKNSLVYSPNGEVIEFLQSVDFD